MIPKYFDVHSHISFDYFKDDRDAVVARMKEQNVGTITVGVDIESSKKAVLFAEQHDDIWATIGLHPNETSGERFIPPREDTSGERFIPPREGRFNEADFVDLVKHPKVVGIGECGLDYYRIKNDVEGEKKRQREDFEAQIEFAVAHDKPLMLHCRPSQGTVDAYEDALDMISSKKREYGEKLRGNFHFFVGNVDVSKKAYTLDFTTSFPGVITFARDYDEVVAFAPLNMILSETDSPYAAPNPYRGKRNEPVYVIEIVKHIASLKKKALRGVAAQLVQNAIRVFGL